MSNTKEFLKKLSDLCNEYGVVIGTELTTFTLNTKTASTTLVDNFGKDILFIKDPLLSEQGNINISYIFK